jgi:hypothetical protein
MMADLHQLMPNAYTLGHLSPPDSNLAAAFNGESIEFDATDVLEGREAFDSLFQRYNAWWSLRGGNAMTIVESVQWAGLASSGLYQLNITVPAVAAGDQQIQSTVSGFQTAGTVMLSVTGVH